MPNEAKLSTKNEKREKEKKKSTTFTVATDIQCVFTLYSVILFISLHNNSPLKCMCIILPAHPNAIHRGDGHFLNCLVVFFFFIFVMVLYMILFSEMLVCSRAFFARVAILLLSRRMIIILMNGMASSRKTFDRQPIAR